ncbi:hypothetical protein LDENG_00101490 [Lucifuga dentata]|nr:hypothetical protein LDENG_00101490 [Lucifuga dentata]
MAETSLGVLGVVKTILRSTAAGFAFGEAALFALEPTLTGDDTLLTAAVLAAERVGSIGVGVVTACLIFTSALLSLGNGFLLAAMVIKLLNRSNERMSGLAEGITGASVVMGAAIAGILGGIVPAWFYISAQCIMALIVYSFSNINEIITALLIIFTTLYISVICGQLGIIFGLCIMAMTIYLLCMLGLALKDRPKHKTGCQLLKRIFFYSVVVAMLGFSIGLGVGEAERELEAEVSLMLKSVLWVAFLSAGLLGSGLGTVAMVGLGPEVAGNVAIGAAVASSVTLRAIIPANSVLGARGSMGGMLGVATAAGVSLGAASVAAKDGFRDFTLALCSVAVGAVLAMQSLTLKTTQLASTSELIMITLVALGAFVLGAPKSPFHTEVNLQRGLLMGPDLISGIGMETVTAAVAPVGAGALGAAVLGTAALGRLGSVGILVAILLAVGKTLIGVMGQSSSPTMEQ